MIRLILGNVGSGKTASIVRFMIENKHKTFITNIDVKGKNTKHILKLKADMIVKKVKTKTKRDGTDVFDLKLNIQFWKDLISKYKTVSVVIDEAHIFFNPRRSMSKLNIIMTDFLALLRRVLGSSDTDGELILITQLSRRLDIIAKEMSNDVIYCKHHYTKVCKKCLFKWSETNESHLIYSECPKCLSYNLFKTNNLIEILKFKSIDGFETWYNYKARTFYQHYFISDINKIFNNYNTLQFDDLFSEL